MGMRVGRSITQQIPLTFGELTCKKFQRQVDRMSREACHSAVAYAVDHGILQRPRICEECSENRGMTNRILAHHDDYSKPLSVRWLCSRCHSEWHGVNKATAMPLEMQGLRRIDYFHIGLAALAASQPQSI
jgi:ribosomal protein S27AE